MVPRAQKFSKSYNLEYALACFYGDGEYFLSKKGCGYVNPPPGKYLRNPLFRANGLVTV